ncbi:hypothetical protein M885DRAFT_623094, partial [Pelagophyceae sp. CCMP2097]
RHGAQAAASVSKLGARAPLSLAATLRLRFSARAHDARRRALRSDVWRDVVVHGAPRGRRGARRRPVRRLGARPVRRAHAGLRRLRRLALPRPAHRRGGGQRPL